MNWQIIKWHILFISAGFSFFAQKTMAWEVDLSRRVQDLRTKYNYEEKLPASVMSGATQETPLMDKILEQVLPSQEIVILNTKNGFVPNQLSLKVGGNYLVHIVNVNADEKNVSFVLDAFGQYHATYFGDIKSFKLTPKLSGVFRYQSPETKAVGQMVVIEENKPMIKEVRKPASVESTLNK